MEVKLLPRLSAFFLLRYLNFLLFIETLPDENRVICDFYSLSELTICKTSGTADVTWSLHHLLLSNDGSVNSASFYSFCLETRQNADTSFNSRRILYKSITCHQQHHSTANNYAKCVGKYATIFDNAKTWLQITIFSYSQIAIRGIYITAKIWWKPIQFSCIL